MNADEVRARLLADLQVTHMVSDAARPGGLTASKLLGCSSQAARILLDEPGTPARDAYRGLRGGWLHSGLNDSLASVDPGFTDGRHERFVWSPGSGLPDVSGEADFYFDGVPIEVKSRPKSECRWHQDHGPDPAHAAQVSAAAAAKGTQQAFVAYLPTDGSADEIAVCEVDPGHWLRETVMWLQRVDVRDEVAEAVAAGVPRERAVAQTLDVIPREPSVQWCREFCVFARTCRGDYVPSETVEIADPVIRLAAQEAAHWRDVRLDAQRREAAAKSRLTHAEGHVSATPDEEESLDVRQQHIAATEGRRGHTRTVISRRPE